MSEEMAEKKRKDIEEFEKQQKEGEARIPEARCPHCGTPMSSFPYLMGLQDLGWIECAACGVVFCPTYVREQKIARFARRREENPQISA